MIIFAEINKSGSDHLQINKALLEIVANDPAQRRVKVVAEQEQLKALIAESACDQLSSRAIKVVTGGYKTWGRKLHQEYRNLKAIFREAALEEGSIILFASMFPISHPILYLMRSRYPQVQVVLALHGELQYLTAKWPAKKFFWLGAALRKVLCSSNQTNITYILFCGLFNEKLRRYIPHVQARFISLEHPYAYQPMLRKIPMHHRRLTLGIVGYAAMAKNSHLFFTLAKQLHNAVTFGHLCMKVVGRVLPELQPYRNEYVVDVGQGERLSPESFDREVNSLDYVIFFYDEQVYELSPSGVLFDAIQMEKPIIALDNDYFNYYFKLLGNIGYLCQSVDDMKTLISGLLQNNLNGYEQQVANMRRAKEILSLNNQCKQFWCQLKEVTG